MKAYIYLQFALSIVSFDISAQNTQDEYLFLTTTQSIPAEDKTVAATLRSAASGGQPKMISDHASFNYTAEGLKSSSQPGDLSGGIIECDTARLYKIGEQPPLITSKEEASCIPIMVDGHPIYINPGDIIYTWERKSASDPIWRAIDKGVQSTGNSDSMDDITTPKADLTCKPDVMNDFVVYYRRKATAGSRVGYSNTIILKALEEYSIACKLSPDKTCLILHHATGPLGANAQITFEQSTDMKTWFEVAKGTLITIDIPSQATYYRCVVNDHKYSNIIFYTPLSLEPMFSDDQNYINTRIYRDNDHWMDQIQYYDGLGRLSQQIDVSASPAGGDIISPVYYDPMGREDAIRYLPYASSTSTGAYQINAANNDVYEYYEENYNDAYPYEEKTYDSSPLNRVVSHMNVGTVFRGDNKKRTYSYLSNSSEDHVIRFTVDNITRSLNISAYDNAKLYKNVVVDEDGTTSISYVNMFDQKLLDRVIGEEDCNHDTYYVYDDFGRLAWVLSPQAVAELCAESCSLLGIDHDIALNYCYIYKYDGQNRCIERKLPGADWEYMVYDKGNRLVLTQNGSLRNQNRWIYNVYDNHNRQTSASLVQQATTLTRAEIQNRYNADGFYNSDQTRGESYKPFTDNSFSAVAVLTESKYGNNTAVQIQGSSPKVLISEVFHDAPVDYQSKPGTAYCVGEYIELYNCDSVEADMSGWKLTGNRATESFIFPAGTKIPAGGYYYLSCEYPNILLTLSEVPEGMEAPLDKQVIYQQNIIFDDSGKQLTLTDAAGNIKDTITVGKPVDETILNYIGAPNEDNTPPMSCRSVQRIKAQFDAYGCAITDNSHWMAGPVTPFHQQSQFTVIADSFVPEYLRPKLVPGILDKGVIDSRTIGLKVYDRIAILNGGDYNDISYVERAYYYDCKGRVVQTVEKNQFGGISRISSKYDFIGNIIVSQESHQRDPETDASDLLRTDYIYDSHGRLLREITMLNDSKPEVIHYGYDKLGQLVSKTYKSEIEHRKIDVSPYCRLSYSPNENELSDLFRDYIAEKMVDYGISDWEQYDYILADGSINPAYFLATENDTNYYYSPIGSYGTIDSWMWEDAIQSFKDEYGLSAACFNVPGQDMGPSATEYYIELQKERGITQTYDYNIQGWHMEQRVMNGTSLLFSSRLYYYNPEDSEINPSYTGSITKWTWQNGIGTDKNTYAFKYDKLSRLTDTQQYIDGVIDDRFVEKGLSYDLNSNINTLTRSNGSNSDEVLEYSYTGNQLASLSGTTSGSYSYDSNGNMTHDGANDLDLTYNHLNLLEKVIGNGAVVANYSYLSDGTKLSATDSAGDGLVYLGSLVYRKQDGALSLESAAFNGGRFVAVGNNTEPLYYITDHLGSVRAIVDSRGEVLERNDYYPYGLRWEDAGSQISDNRYRYNGKEQQAFIDVPYTDYGARMYDERYRISWGGVDQLAERYYPIAPYAFCAANPIRNVDMDGRKIVDASRNVLYKNGTWTKAALGTDAMKLGTAIMKTKEGTKVWNKMVDDKANISLSISSEVGRTPYGSLALGIAETNIRDGEKSVQITVYEGSRDEYIDSKKTFSNREKQEMMRNASLEEYLGAVTTHEGVHSIDDKRDNKREERAVASEMQYLEEVINQKSIVPQSIIDNLFKY